MKREIISTTIFIVGACVLAFVSVAPVNSQAQPQAAEKPVMAEQVFKNVQLLKGISVKEFMEAMGFFAAATNNTCTVCHGDASAGSWEHYADDPPMKQTARRMMLMVDGINRTYFGGKRQVTCYSCHRNADLPKTTPSLPEQYGSPLPEDLDEIARQAPGVPSPDQVLNTYIQAIGGSQKLATLTSFVARGTYEGYDTPKQPVEIYAEASGAIAQIVHGADGDSSWIYDGRFAWVSQPAIEAPVPVLALTAGDLDGAKVEADLTFPGRVKQTLSQLRTGFPITGVMSMLADGKNEGYVGIDDRQLTVVQGTTAAGSRVKLYFDPASGLLVRMVRYTDLPVGLIPTEIDYADYRDVSGIKIPFRITKTWVDGRSVTELSSIQMNAAIDPMKFSKPAEPVSPNGTEPTDKR